MWDVLGLGVKLVFPALQGGLAITDHQRSPKHSLSIKLPNNGKHYQTFF